MHLIPKQRNLDYNLSKHCASNKHEDAYGQSFQKSQGIPVSSGRAGRPQNADKRDVQYRTIGVAFGLKNSDKGQSSQSSASVQQKEKVMIFLLTPIIVCVGVCGKMFWRVVTQPGLSSSFYKISREGMYGIQNHILKCMSKIL